MRQHNHTLKASLTHGVLADTNLTNKGLMDAFKLPPLAPNWSPAFTIVEMVVFIMIMGAVLAGVIGMISQTTRQSTQPLIQKQALAIADSLMMEIQQMPFTLCDPTDANAPTARSYADCTNPQRLGAGPVPSSESRHSNTNPFDNVNDYNGYDTSKHCSGICPIGDTAGGTNKITGLDRYKAVVNIVEAGASFGLASDRAVKITVTVTEDITNSTVVLSGYRVRYAPRI